MFHRVGPFRKPNAPSVPKHPVFSAEFLFPAQIFAPGVLIAGSKPAVTPITITSSDPVSATALVVLVTEIDAESAYTVANDSLEVLVHQGKRQSAAMESAGSSVPVAGTVALCDLGASSFNDGMDLEKRRRRFSKQVISGETVFHRIGPLFRRIGPRVSPERTFSKTERSHADETACIQSVSRKRKKKERERERERETKEKENEVKNERALESMRKRERYNEWAAVPMMWSDWWNNDQYVMATRMRL